MKKRLCRNAQLKAYAQGGFTPAAVAPLMYDVKKWKKKGLIST
jgi:hypothetical protein